MFLNWTLFSEKFIYKRKIQMVQYKKHCIIWTLRLYLNFSEKRDQVSSQDKWHSLAPQHIHDDFWQEVHKLLGQYTLDQHARSDKEQRITNNLQITRCNPEIFSDKVKFFVIITLYSLLFEFRNVIFKRAFKNSLSFSYKPTFKVVVC